MGIIDRFRSKSAARVIQADRERRIAFELALNRELERRSSEYTIAKGAYGDITSERLLDLVLGMSGDEDLLTLTGGRRRVSNTSDRTNMVKMYSIVQMVHLCVKRMAEMIAAVPLQVLDPETLEPIPEHPLQVVLDRPAPQMSRYDLIERTVIYWQTHGAVLWKFVRDGRLGDVREIHVPRAYDIEARADSNHNIIEFVQDLGVGESTGKQRKEIIPLENALYIRNFNPMNPAVGLSPLTSMRIGIETDIAADVWNNAFFSNSGIPGGVLETERRVDAATADRLRSEWEEKHRGHWKAHRIAILPSGLKYREIMVSHSDMDFLMQRRDFQKRILAIYDTPPSVVGFYESEDASSRSVGVETFTEQYWTLGLIPRMTKIINALNRTLGTANDVVFGFDLAGVEALQKNQKTQAETAKAMLGTGLTLNEIRELAYGLSPIESEEFDVVYIPSNFVPAGYSARAPEPGSETGAQREWHSIAESTDPLIRALYSLQQGAEMISSGNGNGNGSNGNGHHSAKSLMSSPGRRFYKTMLLGSNDSFAG